MVSTAATSPLKHAGGVPSLLVSQSLLSNGDAAKISSFRNAPSSGARAQRRWTKKSRRSSAARKERKKSEGRKPMPLYRRAVESFFFSMIVDPHSSSLLLFFPLLRALPSFSLRSLSRTESAPQSEGPYASSSLSALKQRKRTPKDTRKKDNAFAFD